jgi:hypothetical protein
MNKIIITLAALASLSTASLAERHWDLRDSPEAQGSFTIHNGSGYTDASPLAVDVLPSAKGSKAPAIDYRQGTQDQVNN